MKLFKKFFILTLITFSQHQINAVQDIAKESGTTAFTNNIVAKAYDRYSGMFFVGIGTNETTYTIAKAARTDSYFSPLAPSGTLFTSKFVANNAASCRPQNPLLGVLNSAGESATHLVAMSQDLTTSNNEKVFTIKLSNDGATCNASPKVLDANSGQIKGAGALTSLRLATGRYNDTTEYVFLRVYPNGGSDGDQYSGVGCLKLITDTLTLANTNAVKLDVESNAIGASSGGGGNATSAQVEDMYWDNNLQTLFVGLSVTSNNNAANSFANGIVKATINATTGVLENFTTLTANDPIQESDSGATTKSKNTFVIRQDAAFAGAPVVKINKIRTMKTSSGKYYLIINGGAGRITNTQVGNYIQALRLNTDGKIVQNNADGDDLPANWDFDNLLSTTVGGEIIPFQSADNNYITDIEVVCDTVYVTCTGENRDANNDPGIWASQAMFDNNGTTTSWTKWERVYPGENDNDKDKTNFLAVDGKSGKIWQVRGTLKTVTRSEWETSGFTSNSLAAVLTSDLSDGCLAVLDLLGGTTQIGNPTTNPDNSIALFGGNEKVSFARTQYGTANAITTDFSTAENYKLTTLPSDSGYVRCLEYSRPLGVLGDPVWENIGYFFAGTDNGLYVYAQTSGNHAGFNVGDGGGLTTLNAGAFDGTSSWIHMSSSTITGPITHMSCDGLCLYLIEQDVTSIGSITSKLWRIQIRNNVTDMQNYATLIVQSGTYGIPANTIFTGIKTVSNGQGWSARVILTANTGIYHSQIVRVSTTDWIAIDTTRPYHSLYSVKRAPTLISAPEYDGLSSKVWGIALTDGEGKGYYQNSVFRQISTNFNDCSECAPLVPFTYTQQDFTNSSMASGTNTLTFLDRSLYFYTDGGRRFYSRFNANENAYNTLYVLPYYGAEWNMTGPYFDDDLQSVTRVHWIENISGNGQLLAGTDIGVIALQ